MGLLLAGVEIGLYTVCHAQVAPASPEDVSPTTKRKSIIMTENHSANHTCNSKDRRADCMRGCDFTGDVSGVSPLPHGQLVIAAVNYTHQHLKNVHLEKVPQFRDKCFNQGKFHRNYNC